MNKSDGIAELAVALAKAHGKIAAVKREATNPFFKSKYATLDSVVDAVKAPLLAEGIVVVQGLHDAPEGVAIETMLLHTSGQWISSTLRLPASKEDAQGYGSACTYGRRYGLMAMCGVPAEDDDGNAATATAPGKPLSVAGQEWEKLSEEEQKFLQGIADQVRALMDKGGAAAGVAHLEAANLDADEKVALWSRFDSKERSAMKAAQRKAA